MSKKKVTAWITPEAHGWLVDECERRNAPASQVLAMLVDDARRQQSGATQAEVLERLTVSETLTTALAVESATVYRLVHQLLIREFGSENAKAINQRARESATTSVRALVHRGDR